MQDICRLCLAKNDVDNFVFDVGEIYFKIDACLPISISESDEISKKICQGCYKKVSDIYAYFEQVVKSERHLYSEIGITFPSKQLPKNKGFFECDIDIKEEPIDISRIPYSKNEENGVIVLNNNSSLQLPKHPSKKSSFVSALTQTDLSLINFTHFPEINHIQLDEKSEAELDDKNNDESMNKSNDKFDGCIEVKEEFSDVDDSFDNHLGKLVDHYSSEDDLTLNQIVNSSTLPPLKIRIKKEFSNPTVLKKKKAKKKKHDGKTKNEFHTSEKEETKKRGRPKGSANKIIQKDKVKNLKTDNLTQPECDLKDNKDFKLGGDKTFYPEGTADEAKKWQCLTCFSYLSSKNDLLQHYKDHVEKSSDVKNINANEISLKSDTDIKNDLKSESKTDTTVGSDPKIKTGVSRAKFVDYIVLNPSNKQEMAYQCKKCLKVLKNKRAISRHQISHNNSRPHHCNLCGRSYKKAYEILLHGRAHNGVKTLFCEFPHCTYSTVYRGALLSHHKRHEPNYKYTCNICKKGFDVLTWFNEHMNLHTGDRPFCCDLCGKTFIYSRYLSSHRKTVHPEANVGSQQFKHRCEHEDCTKSFSHRKLLRAHSAREHGLRPDVALVLCDICGKGLSSKEQLKFHRRTHTGEKPYVCRICDKGFVKKCNLTLHERVHSGERPHVCSHCGKGFSQKSTLVIHERYHSGVRPYKCEICHKGFVARGLLSVHAKACF